MRRSRGIGLVVIAVLMLVLSGCNLLTPGNATGGGGNGGSNSGGSSGGSTGGSGGGSGGGTTPASKEGSDLVDTNWSGTDSDQDDWKFEFQEDGTLGFSLNTDSYDDATDTWVVEDGTLTIRIVFDDGPSTLTGPYEEGARSIDLEGKGISDGQDIEWTVTVTKD